MDNTNVVYTIMYTYYIDWQLYGYFTDIDEAEQYCIAHADEDLHIEELPCYDGIENLSKVKLNYLYRFTFQKTDNGWINNEECSYDYFSIDNKEQSHSHRICSHNPKLWVAVKVFSKTKDEDKCRKIAQDLFYQFMYECNSEPTYEAMKHFNKILSAAETERKARAEEEAKLEAERQEYERLKKKFESGD